MSSTKQRLLDLAQSDYRPDLVAVDLEAIGRLPARPDRFAHLAPGLIRKPAGAAPETAAAYCIVFNSLNFMLWNPEPIGFRRYQWNGAGGARGLAAGLDQAWGDGADPERLRSLLGSGEEQAVVKALGDISLPRRRAQFLREVLQGHELELAAADLVTAAQSGRLDASAADTLARRFPMAYGQDAYLMRAQLALLWYAGFVTEQGGHLECDITVAAGCQMPRVMRAIRVLRYAPHILDLVDRHVLIMRNSLEERAIRAAAVLGAQAMAAHLGVSEHAIVNALWHNRNACASVSYHLTVTTDY